MERDLENWGNKGSVVVNGVEVETYKTEITDCNILEVEVGTTGHMGGDTGHGGRTYLRIRNLASTDMVCNEHHDNYGHSWVEINLGGDSELDTFYEALQFAVDVLGRETSGVDIPELSPMEQRQLIFANYLNEVCNHYRKNGKLRGFSELQPKYKITPISQQQFFECELHKATGYIPQDFCNRVYAYVLDGGKTMAAPKYTEE